MQSQAGSKLSESKPRLRSAANSNDSQYWLGSSQRRSTLAQSFHSSIQQSVHFIASTLSSLPQASRATLQHLGQGPFLEQKPQTNSR